jgi:hypothetical protein
MKTYLVLGIISLLGAVVLGCAAGIFVVINPYAAIPTACTAWMALVLGVKLLAES